MSDDSNEDESVSHYFHSLFSFPPGAPYTYLSRLHSEESGGSDSFHWSPLAELQC